MEGKSLDLRYLVLALVGYSEEQKLMGRTLLQKRAYFINKFLKLGVPFEPYYYGPYSEKLASATDSLVAEGFLEETSESFPFSSVDIFEHHRYTYTLTPAGREILDIIEKENPVFSRIKGTSRQVEEKAGCDYQCLSIAAKVFHLLENEQREMLVSEICEAAKSLRWQISKEQIDSAAKFLIDMNLIREITNVVR
mgnify:CR=1 FL=1